MSRLTNIVMRIVRKPVAGAALRAIHRTLPGDKIQLARVRSGYRKIYGPAFKTEIHAADEMFRFLCKRHNGSRLRGEIAYLKSGHATLGEIQTILNDVGRPLAQLESLLEFASG